MLAHLPGLGEYLDLLNTQGVRYTYYDLVNGFFVTYLCLGGPISHRHKTIV